MLQCNNYRNLQHTTSDRRRNVQLEINANELELLRWTLVRTTNTLLTTRNVQIKRQLLDKLTQVENTEPEKTEVPTEEALQLTTSDATSLIGALGKLTEVVQKLGERLQQESKIVFLKPLIPEEAPNPGPSVDYFYCACGVGFENLGDKIRHQVAQANLWAH